MTLPLLLVTKWLKGFLLVGFMLLIAEPLHAQKASSVLKGKLLFSNAHAAKGYQVIIVPNNASNEQLTKSSKFLCENSELLKKMTAQSVYTNSEGVYYFKNVSAGKYILKVCTLNGYKYNFVISSSNFSIMTIKDLPATL